MELDLPSLVEKPDWKEVLSEIVFQEGMDPWDIDIILLTDSFIQKVREMKKLNLKISANVILAASILLRFKAESWMFNPPEPENVFIPDEVYAEPIIPELESGLRITTRKVSLEELIKAVQEVISKEKRKAVKTQRIVPENLLRIIETTEDFQLKLEKILRKVRRNANSENLVLFSELLENRKIETIIGHLVCLLHLANEKKLALWQEKFFGEIFICLLEDGNGKEKNRRSRAVHVPSTAHNT